MSRNKSILLQVAFKEAAALGKTDLDKVEQLTGDFYNVLIGLHDKLGLSLEDDAPRRSSRPTNRPAPVTSEDVPTVITADGGLFYDYRNSERKAKNPKFPDFKSVDNTKSIWLTDKEGNQTDEGVKFLESI